MNNSIINIVSQELLREPGSGSPANLQQTSIDASPALPEFGRTLQALLINRAHAEELQKNSELGLSRAQLNPLFALAEESPDKVASLLETEIDQFPDAATVTLQSPILDQSVASGWRGATGAPSEAADAKPSSMVAPSGPNVGHYALSVPKESTKALESPGTLDGAFAGREGHALAADKTTRGLAQERAALGPADAASMPRPVIDNPGSLARVPSGDHLEASGVRESVAPRAEIAPLAGSLSPSSPAVTAPASNHGTSAVAQIQAALGSAQWSGEFGEHMVALTLRGDQQLALHLNPRELGPLVVELAMANNQANLQFVSSQQPVRAAVEAALPELREHFEQQGIALGDASVSDESQRQHGQRLQGERGDSVDRGELSGSIDADATTDLRQTASADAVPGRVNLYI